MTETGERGGPAGPHGSGRGRSDGIGWRLARGALAPFVAGLLRMCAATWRLRVEGVDPRTEGRGALGAFWHRGAWIAAGVYRDSGAHVAVSLSRDGEHIAAVMDWLGLAQPARGSSSRGATGLVRSLVRLARSGAVVAVLADGPRGPARRAKPGVLSVARLARRPVVPVALSARPCVRIGSWDRMLVPLPFARVVCRYGEPLEVSSATRGDALEVRRRELEMRLDQLTDAVDVELGLAPESRPPREEPC